MTNKTYENRKEDLRKILKKNNLDIILLFSDIQNSSLSLWITGTHSLLFHYFFITPTNSGFFEISYLVENLKSKTKEEIKPVKENNIALELQSLLSPYKHIGLSGNAPYIHLNKIEGTIHDITEDINDLLINKSNEEIQYIKESCSIVKEGLERIKPYIKEGITTKEIAKALQSIYLEKADSLSFPISITAKDKIKETTLSEPTNYKLSSKEIICIDSGTKYKGFSSDLTRMYFINYQEAENNYNLLAKTHYEVIKTLQNDMKLKDIVELYKKLLKLNNLPSDTLKIDDLGHSLGFFVHEHPIFYNDTQKDFSLVENMVFTLEPEIVFEDYHLRIEDMILVKNNGIELL